MAASKIRGGRVGSAKRLKEQLKGGGSAGWLWTLKPDEVVDVYFLQEPEDWRDFWQHYDGGTFYPCVGRDNGCPGCEEGNKASHKWLSNVVDMKDNKVRVLLMGVSQVELLAKKYDRRHTLLDRPYELSREGAGLNDTKYFVEESDKPRKKSLRMYEDDIQDLDDVLEAQLASSLPSEDADDTDDEDEEPSWASRRPKKATKGVKRRSTIVDDDDEDEAPPSRRIKPRKVAKKAAPGLLRRR